MHRCTLTARRATAVATSALLRQFAGAQGGGHGCGGRGQSASRDADCPTVSSAEPAPPTGGIVSFFKKQLEEFQRREDRGGDMTEDAAKKPHPSLARGTGPVDDSGARISRNPHACPRSILFVPGSKPRALQKILTLPADCFILDLEDSVGPSAKREAREHVHEFVTSLAKKEDAEEGGSHRRLVLRINSPDFDASNALLDMELAGVLGPLLEGVAVPKVTASTYDLVKEYVHPEHQLWAFFEFPLSVIQAPVICQQRKYKYAVMGYNDLANELQLPTSATTGDGLPGGAGGFLSANLSPEQVAMARLTSRAPLVHCANQVLLSARTAGMCVIDGVFNDPTDSAGLRYDLLSCRSLGFDGKTLIHPSQIAPTNAAFAPSAEEVQWATRIESAVAHTRGGVAVVDGKMIEALHVRQAKRMLALHRAAEAEAAQAKGTSASAAEGSAAEADGGNRGEGHSTKSS